MQLNIDIQGMLADAMNNALSPEKLQPIIQSNIERALKDCIEDQLGYRAPFRELLKTKMAEVMPTDIEGLGMFSDLVMKVIREKLNSSQNDFIAQAIQPQLESLLRPLPATMKVSQLANQLLEYFSEAYEREGGQPTFIIDDDSNVDGYWRFYADPRESSSKYSCKIQMAFNKEGECYSMKLDEREPSKCLLIGQGYGADALALNIYTGKVKIQMDSNDFSDLYYPEGLDD